MRLGDFLVLLCFVLFVLLSKVTPIRGLCYVVPKVQRRKRRKDEGKTAFTIGATIERTMGSLRREKHHSIPTQGPQAVSDTLREKKQLCDPLKDHGEGWTEASGHSALTNVPTQSPTRQSLSLSWNSLGNK